MRVLAVESAGAKWQPEIVSATTGLKLIQPGQYGDTGIARISCASEIDWTWADITFGWADCNPGRHRFDVTFAVEQDATQDIADYITDIADGSVAEDADLDG